MRAFEDHDRGAITALRVLAIDQVEKAKSGHPGLPLGAAPMAYVLWSRFLRVDPGDPEWFDRDRFVLSAGHGSALLYALLHLFGFDLPLAELERFRQWGSKTPGHPEHGVTPGVETTTGPLGQGFANAVGMALAERHLAARFNRDGSAVVDHRTFVIASDGDLMEGLSHEAASLAGHLRLGKLTVLYDDNHITIDGPTELTCSDDVERRFTGYGWHVLHVDDGEDIEAVAAALDSAVADDGAPTLIRVRTHIGFGAPTKHDTAEVHGSPLGHDEWVATRRNLGWTVDEPFVVPDEVRAHFAALSARGRAARAAWHESMARYRTNHPDLAAELERRLRGGLPTGWEEIAPDFGEATSMATRKASGLMLNALAPIVPELIGGSADLAPSNNTLLDGEPAVAAGDFAGRNLHFGVREHAMGAICNGLALHGGVRPYAGTFLIFSDYMRPPVRLAALMRQPVIFLYTHDSIGLGEDGPTHQPIEQLVSLRLIPDLVVLRPADAHETVEAWRIALARSDGPTALALTRQGLPVLAPPAPGAVARGAYVKAESTHGAPTVVLVASGSEVAVALAARERLEEESIPTRVVSAPSLELLATQDERYQRSTLGPHHVLKVAIEAGRGQGWHRWIGEGELIVLRRFGASAPGGEVMKRLGFSADHVVERVHAALACRRPAPPRIELPDTLREPYEEALERLESGGVIERIVARDADTWGGAHAGSAARRLGWLDLPGRMVGRLPDLERVVAALDGGGARTLYLLGMGGSSLAPRVLRSVLGAPSGRELVVLDTTDPERVGSALDGLDPGGAAVVAISKSGATAETSALLDVFWHRMREALGDAAAGRFAVVSEPGSKMARLAEERGYLAVLPHPVDVGGRYSALSAVGLLPALWLGHDVERLLAGGAAGLVDLGRHHPAVHLAATLAAVAVDGWARVALCPSPRLAPLAAWIEQLVAESTGKDGRGVLPVSLTAPPAPGDAWPLTVVYSPRFAGEDLRELDVALDAFAAIEQPVLRCELPDGDLGHAFTVLELATAMLGFLLGVNPFDEPNVARAKQWASEALSAGVPAMPAADDDPGPALLGHLETVLPEDAVALLAYLPENARTARLLDELAAAIAGRVHAPATAAFGPRYLHSTGQLHKGGPDRIVPVVLTADTGRDVPIPGRELTLGRLRAAQALGDLAALREAGRRVLHLHLGDRSEPALEAMIATLARSTPR